MTPEIVNGRERTTGKGLHQSSSLDTLLDSLEIGKRVGCGGGDRLAARLFARRGVSMCRFCAGTPEHPRAFVNLKMLAACQTR